MNNKQIHTALLIIFTIFINTVQAQTTNWDLYNSVDNDWFNPDNWTNGVPVAGGNACLGCGYTTGILLSARATIPAGQTLTINFTLTINASHIEVVASLTNNGTITVNGGRIVTIRDVEAKITNNGIFNNNGSLNMVSPSMALSGGRFINNGTLNNSGTMTHSSTGNTTNNGTLNNTGTMSMPYFGFIINTSSGTLNSSGTINIHHTADDDYYSYLNNIGILNNQVGGIISIQMSNPFYNGDNELNNSGTLQNDGTINNNDLVTNTGSITNCGTYTGTAPTPNALVSCDSDGDGILDNDEIACGSDPNDANSTCEICDGIDNDLNDGIDEGFIDTDSDGQADCVDPDDDNDGVLDGSDNAPFDPNLCEDADGDSCDDCAFGTDGFGPLADNDSNNDGTDTDGDGICNLTDLDDDGDGISDLDEVACGSDPLNSNSTCEICDGIDNDLNDGIDEGFTDTDSDGEADCTDIDDDNDGVLDANDVAPLDPDLCEDADGDTCDDCSVGTDDFGPLADNTPNNDGPDQDGDGICDHGEQDNVGIGTFTPALSAALDIQSNVKGLLIPRLADTNAVQNPATSLMIYDLSNNGFKYFDGAWQGISKSITETDGNTIDLTVNDANITAEVDLDPATENILSSSIDGLKATEVDGSTSNELISGATLNGNNLEITDAGGTISTDLSSLIDDADANPNNELLISANLNGNNLEITDAGGTKTVDMSALNPAESDPEVGANTTNFLPKWNGTALVKSTTVFEDGSGHVGIGTTSPSATLDIRSSTPSVIIGTTANTEGAVYFGNTSHGVKRNYSNGNDVGLYTSSADVYLSSNGTSTSQFVLKNSGKVGIGTPTPDVKLQIEGGTDVSPSGGGYIVTKLGTNGQNIAIDENEIMARDNNGAANLNLNYEGGNVVINGTNTTDGHLGIGTQTPNSKLSISPSSVESKITLYDGGSTTDHYGLGISSSQFNYHTSSSSADHVFYAGGKNGDGTELMRIKGNGNVGIGESNPGYKLHVKHAGFGLRLQHSSEPSNWWELFHSNGDNRYELWYSNNLRGHFDPNSGAYSSTSDRKLKDNISPLHSVLPTLMQLQAKKYTYKSDAEKSEHLGFIAQDVENIFPQLVSLPSNDGERERPYLMNYSGFGVLAIKAIQEQQAVILQQQSEIDLLHSKLSKFDDLENRLAQLENALLQSKASKK